MGDRGAPRGDRAVGPCLRLRLPALRAAHPRRQHGRALRADGRGPRAAIAGAAPPADDCRARAAHQRLPPAPPRARRGPDGGAAVRSDHARRGRWTGAGRAERGAPRPRARADTAYLPPAPPEHRLRARPPAGGAGPRAGLCARDGHRGSRSLCRHVRQRPDARDGAARPGGHRAAPVRSVRPGAAARATRGDLRRGVGALPNCSREEVAVESGPARPGGLVASPSVPSVWPYWLHHRPGDGHGQRRLAVEPIRLVHDLSPQGSEREIAMLFERMVRAARLEVGLYEEVEHDLSATQQALLVVILVALANLLAAIIGSVFVSSGAGHLVRGALGGVLAALVGWVVWSYVTYFVGTRLFSGVATPGELLRTIGFAQSPGVLNVFTFIPLLGGLVALVVAIWMLIAGVIAVRQALDFDTSRAVFTVIVGWLVMLVFWGILALLGLGFVAAAGRL